MHEEILTPGQHGLLRELAPIATAAGLYLAGGTAFALHLGHRRSDDFDWFTDCAPLDTAAMGSELARVQFVAETLDKGTVIGTAQDVRLSCFEYQYRLLEPLVTVHGWDLRMAGLRDLAAMKLLTITQRGSRKDFVDVNALIEHGVPLESMLADFQEKLAIESRISVLRGLVYFDDAEEQPMPEMLADVDWDRLKDRIASAVEALVR